jgi:hypothetical protein
LASGGFDEQYFAAEELYFTMALKKLGRFPQGEPIVTSGRNSPLPGEPWWGDYSRYAPRPAGRPFERDSHLYDGKRESPTI